MKIILKDREQIRDEHSKKRTEEVMGIKLTLEQFREIRDRILNYKEKEVRI